MVGWVGGSEKNIARDQIFLGRGGKGMIKNQINVQDQFLNRVRRDRKHVMIELTTGHQIEGIILSFDNFCII
ncbi:MAG: RNA chaperone Hfq, partial [Thermodesulfobacteriota bacterium]